MDSFWADVEAQAANAVVLAKQVRAGRPADPVELAQSIQALADTVYSLTTIGRLRSDDILRAVIQLTGRVALVELKLGNEAH